MYIFSDDETRFIIKDQENDYINANYINMEIPGSGIINRYIATQGFYLTYNKILFKCT